MPYFDFVFDSTHGRLTATKIITRALRLLGVIASGEDLEASQAADGLEALNGMIDSWNIEPSAFPGFARGTHVLTSGQAEYTLALDGDIVEESPASIQRLGLMLGDVEIPIGLLANIDEYGAIPDKATEGQVEYGYYDGHGTLTLWPVPNSAQTLVLYLPVVFAEFDDLTTEYIFPKGFSQALAANLAMVLAPEYGLTPSADVYGMAQRGRADVFRVNDRRRPIRTADGGMSSRHAADYFDWRIGR